MNLIQKIRDDVTQNFNTNYEVCLHTNFLVQNEIDHLTMQYIFQCIELHFCNGILLDFFQST